MQHVNLYTDAFKPKRVILPLEQIVALPIAMAILLIGISFWLSHQLELETQELQALQAKNESMTTRLADLEVRSKKMKKDESLVAANQRLYAKAEARQQMIDMLDTVVVKDDEGFSEIMLSLARQRLEKLWLSSIYIGASGKEMQIEGFTQDGDLVPSYLQNLRQEDSFIGRTFTLFELAQHEGEDNTLSFALRTQVQSTAPEVLLSHLDNSQDMLQHSRGLQPNSLKQGGE